MYDTHHQYLVRETVRIRAERTSMSNILSEGLESSTRCSYSEIPDASRMSYRINNIRVVSAGKAHRAALYGCDDRLASFPMDNRCSVGLVTPPQGPCFTTLWAYDHLSESEYVSSLHSAIRVGLGTQITRLLLQIHYVAPTEPDLSDVFDDFGADVDIISTLVDRRVDAYTFYIVISDFGIPIGSEHNAIVRSDSLDVHDAIGHDLDRNNNTVDVVQVHFLAHATMTRLSLYRRRPGDVDSIVFSVNPSCASGKCESSHNVSFKVDGHDALSLECVTAMKMTMRDTEICGAILTYSPHDYTFNFNGVFASKPQ